VWEENAADSPVDIYALGCIAYEMLTGELLFQSQTLIQAARAHDRGPQFPAIWPEDVPRSITAVLSKALARDPAARHPSAGALWQALNDLKPQVIRTVLSRTLSKITLGAGGLIVVVLCGIMYSFLARLPSRVVPTTTLMSTAARTAAPTAAIASGPTTVGPPAATIAPAATAAPTAVPMHPAHSFNSGTHRRFGI
jgi:serine/threonine protein kinase